MQWRPSLKIARMNNEQMMDYFKFIAKGSVNTREIAHHFEITPKVASFVLRKLKAMNIISGTRACVKGEYNNHSIKVVTMYWVPLVSKEEALNILKSLNPNKKEVGIDEDDLQWQKHYRNQLMNRYQKAGVQPPKHIFHD